jgi:hypothetical protein
MSFDVCPICQGCHLTTTRKTLVEFGHTNEIQRKPSYGSCANKPKKNMNQNRVIHYWMDMHDSHHTTIPEELSGLKFAEKQLISVSSSHISLIHLMNGTLGSRIHCVAVEQDIAKLFLILPIDPIYLNILSVRRSEISSDQ